MSKNYLSKSEVLEIWGESFEEIANHPQIGFLTDCIEVTLKRTAPIVTIESGTPTKVLRFEEPTVGTLKLMDTAKGEIGKVSALIQGAGNIPAASVDKIKSGDFVLISKVVAAFLQTSQVTTGT